MKSTSSGRIVATCLGATLLFSGCEKPNTAPVALFSFTPSSGAMDTLFTFDASGSSDGQDDTCKLMFRWDWEADGIWDTEFNFGKTASHRFTTFEGNEVMLEVKDSKALTATLKKPVSITDEGIITGMDPRMCPCCGGWWIRLQNDTLRFDQLPAGSVNILDNVKFPLSVRVKWAKKTPRCMGDEILIFEMIRQPQWLP